MYLCISLKEGNSEQFVCKVYFQCRNVRLYKFSIAPKEEKYIHISFDKAVFVDLQEML